MQYIQFIFDGLLSVMANVKVDPLKRPKKCHKEAMSDRTVQYSVRANRVYTAQIQQLLKKLTAERVIFKYNNTEVNFTILIIQIICEAQQPIIIVFQMSSLGSQPQVKKALLSSIDTLHTGQTKAIAQQLNTDLIQSLYRTARQIQHLINCQVHV